MTAQTPELKSIDEEAADCRTAWAAAPGATAAVHLHHDVAADALLDPIEFRIAYILTKKPEHERALRLRLMRPLTAPARAEYGRVTAQAWAEYERVRAQALAEYERVTAPALAEYKRVTKIAHDAICFEGCPFDGSTIFPVTA